MTDKLSELIQSEPTEAPAQPHKSEKAESSVTQLPSRQRTHRARGLVIVAVGMLSLAVVFGTGSGLLLITPLILAICYYRITGLPEVSLSATRDFSKVAAVPGDNVAVSVTITNESTRSIPDLRVRDNVPEGLSVIDGSPMASFSLLPGESETINYTVRARRGRHSFETVEVLSRTASGSEREQRTLSAERTLVSEVSVDSLPLAPRASQYTGRMQTTASGSGVEFFSTREYHPSDSPRDIDWRRYAKTGEFTTIQYNSTNAASIQLLVDARMATHENTMGAEVQIQEMCLYAAELIAENLMESRHEVGVTVVRKNVTTHFPCKSPRQYQQIRQTLTAVGSASDPGPEEHRRGRTTAPAVQPDRLSAELADEFLSRTDSHTQFVCITGGYDEAFDAFLSRLGRVERPVFVITPDYELAETPGSQLAAVHREMRLDKLRRTGVTVLEWDTNESLRLALKRRLGGVWG